MINFFQKCSILFNANSSRGTNDVRNKLSTTVVLNSCCDRERCRLRRGAEKHNFLFVIASVSEAISNKLKDCHVAIAPRNDAKCCVAFTLAEILITLAIIGVVSAMTIPTLIIKHQKMIIEKRITQDYSIVQQVLRMHVVDSLDMSIETTVDNTTYIKNWYDKYWAPYLKTAKVCVESSGCWHSDGQTQSLAGSKNGRTGIGVGTRIVTVRLQNGSSLCFDIWNAADTGKLGVNTAYKFISIFVDANGDSKPNVIGKDIYVFVWTKEHGLVPAGYSLTPTEIRANCSNKATGSYAGYFCLARVKLDGWKILDEVWNINK